MDDSRRQFYSKMWRSAAEGAGARLIVLNGGRAQIEKSGHAIQVQDNITSLDPAVTLRRAGDKPAVRRLLARSGIAVPKYIVIGVDEFEKATQMLQGSRRPLVVKPAEATSGGAGVTTNVATLHQLGAAVAWARSFGPRILIEEQVAGDCYRVLVMDGEVLDVVVRHPPRVIGDGVSTISRLIRRENRLRLREGATRAQCLIGCDPDLRNTLARQGLSVRTRPARGEAVILKQVINDNSARENVPANGRLCPAILEAACQGAKIIGARLAGVDIMCSDPEVPLEISGGAIIEVNATPGFYYHYNKGADASAPVADRVLNRFFSLVSTHQWTKASSASG